MGGVLGLKKGFERGLSDCNREHPIGPGAIAHGLEAAAYWGTGLGLLSAYGLRDPLDFMPKVIRFGAVFFGASAISFGLGYTAGRIFCDPERNKEVPNDLPFTPVDQAPTGVGGAVDPNDIIGPAGVGEENWLTSPQTLPYTIRFENDAEKADAPAVFVTVTQQLDSDLDWNSFELGNFGFGDINIEIPPGYQNYTERIDLTETIGYFVDFNAEMNAETGAVKYTLETIDPETGEYPTDFDAGFLPPNVNPPEGDGFISYTISPGEDVQTGDVIDAEASIVFDTNDPIATPPYSTPLILQHPPAK